jgi:hypothetical protein
MADVVARIDDFGRPAWIALMVLGFIVFWPLGLGILAYLLWSGRMGCGRSFADWQARQGERWERRRARFEARMQRWGGYAAGMPSTGNRAFDEYREEALRRLESEAAEFREFLQRLRMAKDRAEFDAFMRERRERGAGGGTSEGGEPQPST